MPEFIVNNFSGGLADSNWRGVEGSFADAVGINIHETPGIIIPNQTMKKESGATVTELCKNVVVASDGNSYWFSSVSGKIWKRTSAGSWSLVHTNTGGACLGAIEFNGYIYYCCAATMGRQTVALAASEASWASQNDAYAAFDNDDSEYHPMVEVNNILCVGDGYKIATLTTGLTWTTAALSLPSQFRVSCLYPDDIYLLIGTKVGTSATIKVNYAKLFRWDTYSDSWRGSDVIYEAGINCFIPADNQVFVSAGMAGNIYYYNGAQLIPFKKIPGTYSPTRYNIVYPQAMGVFKGLSLFGLSNSPDAANSTGNPSNCGIYSIGSHSKNYPRVLNLEFPTSATLPLASVEIGCIAVIGNDLLASWKKTASGPTYTYGVDILDTANKYASAYITAPVLNAGDVDKKVIEFFAGYASKPASTSITFSYKKNYASSFSDISNAETETKNQTIIKRENIIDCRAFQMKITFTVNSNDAMSLDVFGCRL